MCGIFCLISPQQKNDTCTLLQEYKLFEKQINRRGPDSTRIEFSHLKTCEILLAASVLWLQGNNITVQPLKSERSLFAYNGDVFGGPITNEAREDVGDTILFLKALEHSDNVVEALHSIQGPYAFIYVNIPGNKIYFGRDIYGRRSLLIGKNKDRFIITSVARKQSEFDFTEVPAVGTFLIDLNTNNWHVFPWKNKIPKNKLKEFDLLLQATTILENVNREVFMKFRPPNESELKQLNEILAGKCNIFGALCDKYWPENILKLRELLESSIRKRISIQSKFCQNCFKEENCKHAVIGLLFSGGVDCAILALLISKIATAENPIDLINVAFEKDVDYKTPDRLTAHSTLKELQVLSPQTKWNLVEVNVTKEELNSCRLEYISDLIYPLKTILDDSLGCALWFASRAKTAGYKSPCRILFVGMGADELFGGYTRHRAAFQKGSWRGLHEALEEDWQNVSSRNLSRDDRVVADHGRQLRTPYLDEQVVEFLRNLQCWQKTLPTNDLPQGIGEKILLRCVAYQLGLSDAAALKKRALQFGSRIANPKEKGHETSTRL